MTANSGAWLEDLTWPEAAERFAGGAPVLLPVAAASKAHGPHLPLKTDALTARALAQRLLERLPLVVAPIVGHGFYPAFDRFAGSQHLSEPTFRALLHELIDGLRRQGVRRLAILNVGVSTEAPIDAVCGGADDLLVLHVRALGGRADALLDVREGYEWEAGHAPGAHHIPMSQLEQRQDELPDDEQILVICHTGARSRMVTDGVTRAPHRAFLRATGLDDASMQKPFVAIVDTFGENTPCSMSLNQVSDNARLGVAAGGGVPIRGSAISVSDGTSMNHSGMRMSLVSREIVADSVELFVRAHAYDALIGVAGFVTYFMLFVR